MRRKPLLIAVTAVVALLGAGAAGIASAASSGASITFTTIGRTGAKVASQITLVSSPDNTRQYTLGTGKAYTIAKGTYAMMTDVYNPADGTDTMAGRLVKVSGTTAITFDARLGKQVNVSMTGVPAGYTQQFSNVRVCTDATGFASVDASSSPGRLFVIPDSAKQLQFAFLSYWSDPSNPAADSYAAVASIASMPGKPNWTFAGTSTGAVRMSVLRGPQGGTSAGAALQPLANSCINEMYAQVASGPAPFTATVHVNPGTWDLRVDESADNGDVIGNFDSNKKVAAGLTYSQTYYRAAWGPGRIVPTVSSKQVSFDTGYMFKDPGFSGGFAGEASEKSTVTLSLKRTLLATSHPSDWADGNPVFTYKLSKAGWYVLNVDAVRYRPGIQYPAGMLSPKASVSFNFPADPAVDTVAPLWTTRFMPVGLNSDNAAAAGSTTTVDLYLDRAGDSGQKVTPGATLKTLAAQASYDEGKTWHAVTVKSVSGTWVAVVPNPATAGSVSLRATATEKASGANATTTVIRAYAVS